MARKKDDKTDDGPKKKSYVESAISDLADYHNFHPSDLAIKDYISCFSDTKEDALRKITSEWKRAHSPQTKFPSIAELIGFKHGLWAKEWQEKKESEWRAPISQPKVRSQMGRESFRLIHRLFLPHGDPERLTQRELVDGGLRMEKNYPGKGWREAADRFFACLGEKEKREARMVDEELRRLEAEARAELSEEDGEARERE